MANEVSKEVSMRMARPYAAMCRSIKEADVLVSEMLRPDRIARIFLVDRYVKRIIMEYGAQAKTDGKKLLYLGRATDRHARRKSSGSVALNPPVRTGT